MSKLKWKRPKHKNAYPWQSSDVDNYAAVLEEQFNTVDENKKEVKWMWQIQYNDGHVGCPGYGYCQTLEEAKSEAAVWFRGYYNGKRVGSEEKHEDLKPLGKVAWSLIVAAQNKDDWFDENKTDKEKRERLEKLTKELGELLKKADLH